ncbi:MAG TPA: RidA family protein [Actinomycetota bacterium]
MNDADIVARLSSMGIELPEPPAAVAAYLPVVMSGGLAFVAGQVALVGGELLHPGRLGEAVSLEQGTEAARRCALQALSALRSALGGTFDRLERVLKVDVFVASTPAFTDQPKVANGASELLAEVLGEPGRHARAAVGVASLPLGACVEVALTAAISG